MLNQDGGIRRRVTADRQKKPFAGNLMPDTFLLQFACFTMKIQQNYPYFDETFFDAAAELKKTPWL